MGRCDERAILRYFWRAFLRQDPARRVCGRKWKTQKEQLERRGKEEESWWGGAGEEGWKEELPLLFLFEVSSLCSVTPLLFSFFLTLGSRFPPLARAPFLDLAGFYRKGWENASLEKTTITPLSKFVKSLPKILHNPPKSSRILRSPSFRKGRERERVSRDLLERLRFFLFLVVVQKARFIP